MIQRILNRRHSEEEDEDVPDVAMTIEDLDDEEPLPDFLTKREPAAVPVVEEPAERLHLDYCNTACGRRESCPLRNGFLKFHDAFTTVAEGFPASPEYAELHINLGSHVAPFIQTLAEDRESCAQAMHAEHVMQEAESQRLQPAFESAFLQASGVKLTELGSKLGKLDAMHDLLLKLATRLDKEEQDVENRLDQAMAEEDEDASLLDVDGERVYAPVTNDQAWVLIQQAREAYPNDDRLAVRHLFSTTGVTLNQASRVARQHDLQWTTRMLSAWRNEATTKPANSSLNRERGTQAQKAAADGE